MATVDSVVNVRGESMHDSNSKKNKKRKHKSLVVLTNKDSSYLSSENLSLSAGCENSTIRSRFSFRNFGRNRQSKSSLTDVKSISSSTTSVDCSSNTTSSQCEPQFQCPIITYNNTDDTQLSPQIESKC